jgi:hypothetical protein
MKLNKNGIAFVEAAEKLYGIGATLNRDNIAHVVNEADVPYPYWFVTKADYRGTNRGEYVLPNIGTKQSKAPIVEEELAVAYAQPAQVLEFRQPKLLDESDPCVPEKMNNFVPFGFYSKLKQIIKSKEFFPVFITGLSGNGKTLSVEQSCAELNRELVRINLSVETDESDLIGGLTLIGGNVVFKDGPVLTAMKRGAVLLLDECDRAGSKLLCLQSIMEGKPYYVKKTGQVVNPAPGFTIIATANTKGQGAADGKFLAQIMDSAFLQRFVITVEQEFPEPKIEKRILTPLINDSKFVENLVQWAEVVRKSYMEGATDEIISTRKLTHIAKIYSVFKDKMEALTLCLNGYDDETKLAFLDLYSKIDDTVENPANTSNLVTNTEMIKADPF